MLYEKVDMRGGAFGRSSTYVASNGVRVVTSGTIYSNSNYYYLAYLFNNSPWTGATNYWMNSGGNGGTLTIDLRTLDRPVTMIRILPYTRNDSSSNYQLRGSDDGSTWVNLTPMIYNHHSSSNANYIAPGVFREHKLDKPYKFLRLYLTYQGSWGTSLNEIELYYTALDGNFLLQKDNTLYKFQETILEVPSSTNLVPLMTSNTAPSGIASASSQWDASNYAPYRAFNRSAPIETNCWHVVSGAVFPQWLAYEFVEPQVIKRFAITSRYTTQATQAPRDFILQGRLADSTVWENIKSYTQPNGWASNTTRYFDCSENNIAYKAYRLYITVNTAGNTSGQLSIASWEMFGDGTKGERSKFITYSANNLSYDFLLNEGVSTDAIGDYNRRLVDLDFMDFNIKSNRSYKGRAFSESKMQLDLKKYMDVRKVR